MIEYFALKYLKTKKEQFDENNKVIIVTESKNSTTVLLELIISLAISIYAAYIAYNCNKGETQLVQVLITIFAFLFGFLYLVYYAIIYKLAGAKCPKK